MSQNIKPKVLLVGPEGPHLKAHLELIEPCTGEIRVVTNRMGFDNHQCEVVITDFSLKSATNWRNTPRFIRKQIEDFKPDVIHVHQANSYAFYTHLANRKTTIPVVLTLWGSDVLVLPQRGALYKAMVRFNLRHAHRLTADAQYLADRASALAQRTLPVLICNFGVNPSAVTRTKEPVIYSNRNHEALYRIDAVIEQFKRFSADAQGEGWRLVIAGRGSQTERLKQQVVDARLSEKVEFVGFLSRDENEQWYARASLFASLPTSDATAISLLEAMYHGCIPVVSDLPANREWITAGQNGVIVTDLTTNAFSQALQLDAESLAKRNRALIEEKGLKSVAREQFCRVLTETAALASGRIGRKT